MVLRHHPYHFNRRKLALSPELDQQVVSLIALYFITRELRRRTSESVSIRLDKRHPFPQGHSTHSTGNGRCQHLPAPQLPLATPLLLLGPGHRLGPGFEQQGMPAALFNGGRFCEEAVAQRYE